MKRLIVAVLWLLLSACGGGGGSDDQSPAPVPPAAPTNLSVAAVSSAAIQVSWTDAASDETAFSVERSTSASGPWLTFAVAANSQSFTDSGLTASSTYHYRVAASNDAGTSPYAGPLAATTLAPAAAPPAAPGSLSATAISSSSISLSWTDNSNDETGFKIERAQAASGPFTQLAAVGAGVTTLTNISLSASTTYFYRVRATNSAGDSAYSNTASATTPAATATPAAPSNLVAAATSTSAISLSWADNSNNEAGFRIERSTSPSSAFAQIAVTAAGATAFSDSGLAASTTYYYRVRATNGSGESGYSNTANATTFIAAPVIAPPTGLVATATSTSSISLTWADHSNNETGFKIERAPASAGPFAQIIVVGAGSTSFSDTGLTASTTYYYRVRATNSTGDSAFSNMANATTHNTSTLPFAPSNLNAIAATTTSISLSWTDNSTNETSFKIERAAAAAGPFTQIATTAAGVTTFTNTGLSPLTAYFYRVRASNAAGDSPYSNVDSAATGGTVALNPVADNLTLINNQIAATANTNFRAGELAVGCNWGQTIDGFQTFVCGRSLVRFDVSSLAGRTIDSATLRLTVQDIGVGSFPRPWHVWAVASAWNTTTVTWNQVNGLQFYVANRINNIPAPTFSGQQINLNVLGIVQSWANGNFTNNGVILESENYTFPNAISFDAFAFYSLEDPGQDWPKLIVTYR